MKSWKPILQELLESQQKHYGEMYVLASAGSLLHRGEADITEGVIKGIEYCIAALEEEDKQPDHTTAATTPEPVAFRMRHHLETEERDWSVMPIRFLERNNHPVYVIELLYTQPAPPSELVKAAESAYQWLKHLDEIEVTNIELKRFLPTLRAVLDKTK